MRVSASIKAALLYLLPAFAIAGIWFFLLFTNNASTSPSSTFIFVLTDGPSREWFWWLLTLPILCIALAAAYASPLSRSHSGSILLLAIGVLLAGCAWFTVSQEIALFVSLPLLFGFLNMRQQTAGP